MSTGNPGADQLPSRIRFAKSELVKALTALERLDASELTAWMRVLDLEEQLADQREETADWRRRCQAMQQILAAGKRTEGF